MTAACRETEPHGRFRHDIGHQRKQNLEQQKSIAHWAPLCSAEMMLPTSVSASISMSPGSSMSSGGDGRVLTGMATLGGKRTPC